MSRVRAAFALATLCGCSPEPLVLQVPFEAGDEAAVIAVEGSGVHEVYALDAADRDAQPILRSIEGWRSGRALEVTALFYSRPLARLEIPPGLLVSDRNGRRALPAATRARRVALEDPEEIAWSEASTLPPLLADLRLSDASAVCATVTRTDRDLGVGDAVPVGVIHDGAGGFVVVLASGPERRVRVVDRFGTRTSTVVELPAGFVPLTAVDGGGGWIFLGGGVPGGDAQVLALGPSMEVLAAAPAASEDAWPRALVRVAGRDVYALSGDGALSRLALGAFAPVLQLAPGARGALAADGDVLWVVAPDAREVFRVVDGVPTLIPTELDPNFQSGRDELTTVAVIPGGGTYLGTELGALMVLEGSVFRVAALPTLAASTVRALAPFAGGMAVAGRAVVEQYHPGRGFCDDPALLGINTEATHAAALDAGAGAGASVVVVGLEDIFGRTPFAAELRPGL
ncbi:MAG: hypothetical protein KC933_10470 [Myxococcales bacterium]|nr:hypothetical protein [Myxococcales bacterium]